MKAKIDKNISVFTLGPAKYVGLSWNIFCGLFALIPLARDPFLWRRHSKNAAAASRLITAR